MTINVSCRCWPWSTQTTKVSRVTPQSKNALLEFQNVSDVELLNNDLRVNMTLHNIYSKIHHQSICIGVKHPKFKPQLETFWKMSHFDFTYTIFDTD